MSYSLPPTLTASSRPGFEVVNQLINSIKATAWGAFFLGGSLSEPHPGTSYVRVVGAVPWYFPTAAEGGAVFRVRTFMVCENASTTITAKLYDLTAAADVSGTTTGACSGTSADFSGTNQTQGLTFTPVAGHLYELRAIKSDSLNQCWAIGYVERKES